jgi:hypothetical protein
MKTDVYTASQLREESRNGLKIYVETAWGWTEVKVDPFLKQVETGKFLAWTTIRRDGGVTLKVPCRG